MTTQSIKLLNKKTKNLANFLFLIFILGFLCSCQKQPLYKEKRMLMGTFVEVKSPDRRAAGIVFKELERLDKLLSKYHQGSDVWRLNRFKKVRVSEDTLYVIKKAKDFWEKSNAAFDITIEPLLEIWGFDDKKYHLPEERLIKSTLDFIGSDKLLIDERRKIIEFRDRRMRIDLGGLAKGYALDSAVKKLREAGINNALLNAGGDIYCLGTKYAKSWQIAVKDPRKKGVILKFPLQDQAVATSGDYEQFFIFAGQRYSHIFDPATGAPSESGIISVTVLANDCLTADALATAVFVLGPVKGEELVKRFRAEIINLILQ